MRCPESCILIFLAALLPSVALAAAPAWTAQGGSPVVLSADGSTVLSDGEIFALFTSQGTQLWKGYGGSYAQSQGEIYSPLALTADGKYAVLGSGQGLLYVDRNQKIFWQDSEFHPVDDLSLSPDENYVASVAQNRVTVYTRGGDILWRYDRYTDLQYVGVSSDAVLTVAASKDLIHAFNKTGYEVWNYSTTGIHGVGLSPANSDIIAASDYTLVCLHPSGNLLWKFYTGDPIRDFAISRDGSSIAVGNQAGRLVLLDRDGKQVFSTQLGNWVNAVAVSGDGSRVAAGNSDRKVYLFDRSGQLLFSDLTGSIVRGIAISSDGSALAATSDMLYYYDLKESPTPASTTVPPAATAAVTTAVRPLETTPAPSIAAVTTPERPPAEETAPEETTTAKSGSMSLAVLAVGIGAAAWAVRRR